MSSHSVRGNPPNTARNRHAKRSTREGNAYVRRAPTALEIRCTVSTVPRVRIPPFPPEINELGHLRVAFFVGVCGLGVRGFLPNLGDRVGQRLVLQVGITLR